jgi:hypothetical protein
MIEYKVAELMIVTDETLEQMLNTWTQQGWTFDSLHCAMSAGSKRPAMAFLFFVRSLETTEEAEEGKGEML